MFVSLFKSQNQVVPYLLTLRYATFFIFVECNNLLLCNCLEYLAYNIWVMLSTPQDLEGISCSRKQTILEKILLQKINKFYYKNLLFVRK